MQNNNKQVQLLKWMLEDVRKVTFKGIEGLDKEQLFKAPAEGEYPIGSYLMHFAECEVHWFERMTGREQSEELKKKVYFDKWFDPSGEADPPKEAPEISYYLDALAETGKILTDELDQMNDDELEEEIVLKRNNEEIRRTKKWIIYHLIEHEAHHRGQMFMLIRMGKLKNDNK
jgi:uncharacterized damage-inducible protein DinB